MTPEKSPAEEGGGFNLSGIFIRRPVMTTLVMLGILLFGIMGYLRLPVSDLPNVDFPTILVTAQLPGASPETMASAVATPLEKEFSTIAGLDSMNSANASSITDSPRLPFSACLSRIASISAICPNAQPSSRISS